MNPRLTRSFPMPLFVNPLSQEPLRFYLTKFPAKTEVEEIITARGGLVVDKPVSEDDGKPILILAPPESIDKLRPDDLVIDPVFIRDCVTEDILLDYNAYRVNDKSHEEHIHQPKVSARHKFTPEESERLKEAVEEAIQENLKFTRTGMKVFEYLAEQFPNHTPQSLHNHYRKFILASPKRESPIVAARKQTGIPLEIVEEMRLEAQTQLLPSLEFTQFPLTQEPNSLVNEDEDEKSFLIEESQLTIPLEIPVSPRKNKTLLQQVEKSRRVFLALIEKYNLPPPVVLHALYTHSGIVADTIYFLDNPEVEPLWTPTEDHWILMEEEGKMRALEAKKGVEAVRTRKEFLYKVCAEPLGEMPIE